MINIDKKLDQLKKIKPAEAPPFLFTRIEAAMQHDLENKATPQWRLGFATAFFLLLIANLYVVFSASQQPKANEIGTVVAAMNMSGSNSLYE